jgi:hypothetical protein
MSGFGFSLPLCDTFVDDSCTAGPLTFVTDEVDRQEAFVVRIMGPKAAHKREIGSLIDVIGVRFNTADGTVGFSFKGFLKLVICFFTLFQPVPPRKPVFPTSTIQVMASLFYRYGLFVPLLHTASVMYHALRSDPKRQSRRLSYAQLDCISSWRCFLFMSFSRASLLSTPCYDYYHNSPDLIDLSEFGFHPYCCYTDASPSTIGLFVPSLGWCRCLLSDFVPDDWSIANVEMLGLLLGFAFAVLVFL